MYPRIKPATANPPPLSPDLRIWPRATCPKMTAAMPPTKGHKNQEMMPNTSDATAAEFVRGPYTNTAGSRADCVTSWDPPIAGWLETGCEMLGAGMGVHLVPSHHHLPSGETCP